MSPSPTALPTMTAAALAMPKTNTVANCWITDAIWLAETTASPSRPRIMDWTETPTDHSSSLKTTGSPWRK